MAENPRSDQWTGLGCVLGSDSSKAPAAQKVKGRGSARLRTVPSCAKAALPDAQQQLEDWIFG